MYWWIKIDSYATIIICELFFFFVSFLVVYSHRLRVYARLVEETARASPMLCGKRKIVSTRNYLQITPRSRM